MNKKLLFGILAIAIIVTAVWVILSYPTERVAKPEHYPETVGQTYFDDSKKANNTVALLIKTYKPLTEDQIQILRNSGVKKLSASEIETIYHGLIEENKVDEVKNLNFVEDVYPYKVK